MSKPPVRFDSSSSAGSTEALGSNTAGSEAGVCISTHGKCVQTAHKSPPNPDCSVWRADRRPGKLASGGSEPACFACPYQTSLKSASGAGPSTPSNCEAWPRARAAAGRGGPCSSRPARRHPSISPAGEPVPGRPGSWVGGRARGWGWWQTLWVTGSPAVHRKLNEKPHPLAEESSSCVSEPASQPANKQARRPASEQRNAGASQQPHPCTLEYCSSSKMRSLVSDSFQNPPQKSSPAAARERRSAVGDARMAVARAAEAFCDDCHEQQCRRVMYG